MVDIPLTLLIELDCLCQVAAKSRPTSNSVFPDGWDHKTIEENSFAQAFSRTTDSDRAHILVLHRHGGDRDFLEKYEDRHTEYCGEKLEEEYVIHKISSLRYKRGLNQLQNE
jgi:hypothetical protein